jgi:hypothetical protein
MIPLSYDPISLLQCGCNGLKPKQYLLRGILAISGSKGLVLVILELIFGALLESGACPCTTLVTGLGVWSFAF